MNQALFSLKGLTLAGSDVPRLKSLTLQVPCGTTAVVGLSGAGKTSLLNVLAGFESTFSGELKSHVPQDAENRLPLFWVPQNGGLWPHLTAKRHLDIVADEITQNQTTGAKSGRVSKRTDEFLSLFDLNHRQQALPAELSQGERSRLALARALATRAIVLLLDEPLSHVDPVRKPGYWRIVQQIVAEENLSMIFTSHEPETVLRQAEHVICLRDGSVVFDGAVRTLYNNPPDAQVGEFLGPVNWFRAEEAAMFFLDHSTRTAGIVIRPERLRLEIADGSQIEVVSRPFCGMYAESIVKHQASGVTRSVLHRVPNIPVQIGDRVAFRVMPSTGDKP
jgi:ABC-type multidrug transport system ATPase subunit